MGSHARFDAQLALTAVLALAACAAAQRSTVGGQPCVFPFTFEGQEYNDCVESEGIEWCSTASGEFDMCDPSSAPSASVATPVAATPTPPVSFANGGSDCCGLLAGIGFSSSLPVVIIDSGGQQIPDEPKIQSYACTCNAPGGDVAGSVGIEIRGSTSARDFLKKSFAVEFRDEQGNDMDVTFMGGCQHLATNAGRSICDHGQTASCCRQWPQWIRTFISDLRMSNASFAVDVILTHVCKLL
ncbi:unnamed protein product [Ostreobium quekettii]|uniref:Fibronectin type-II domain-containing protein n=1 Tax=Ostreobium quekettii TaxID=121088 RepID=A0A8S1J7F1_9CHLO|nr:unnamed protein product [Ostreobium quekettii]